MPDYSDLIREGYAAFNKGERAWALEHMTPDVIWAPPPEDPEGTIYHGHAGVVDYWDQWKAAVGQLIFEILEMLPSGDDVLVRVRRSGTGRHSGLSVSDEVAQVFSFNAEGRCFRVREFSGKEDAVAFLAVAGAEAGRPAGN